MRMGELSATIIEQALLENPVCSIPRILCVIPSLIFTDLSLWVHPYTFNFLSYHLPIRSFLTSHKIITQEGRKIQIQRS